MNKVRLEQSDARSSPRLAEVIFSSRDGYVWASWTEVCTVRLGPLEAVAAMMRDFLAQEALGKRLTERYTSTR